MNTPQIPLELVQPSSTAKVSHDLILKLLVDLVGIWGNDGYFQPLNPAWEQLLGWTDSELRSQPLIEWIHPEDRELTQTAIRRCLPGEMIECENRLRHKGGHYCSVVWRLLVNEEGLIHAVGKEWTNTNPWVRGNVNEGNNREDITDQELALQKAYKQLTLHVENSPLAVLEWDEEFRLRRWSGQAEKLFGWQAEELIGKHPTEWRFIYEDDFDTINHLLTGLLDGTKHHTVDENRNYTKDGSVVYCQWHNSVILDEAGELVSILSLVQDITERKQAEIALQEVMGELETRVEERTLQLKQINEQLQAEIAEHKRTAKALGNSEKQFRRVFDEAPIGMTLATLDDCYIGINRAFYQMLGYSQSELMALSFKDITYPDDLELEIPYMEQLIQGDIDSFQLEKRYVKKNQEIVWVALKLIGLRGQSGELLYTLAMIEDITKRKQVLEELHQSQARYRAIIEDQTELICRFKPDGTLTFVNNAYCRYFGKKRSELIGSSFMPTIPEADQDVVATCFGSLSITQPIITYEHRVILPNGEVHWQQWTDRAMFDDSGSMIEFQAVGRDITPLKQAEIEIRNALEKAEELSELRSSFVSLVSHEFRTPLTTILSSSELLERYDKKLSDAKKQSHHRRIELAVHRMTQLLDDVLTIGKAEAGKLTFNPVPMNLGLFCYEIVESFQVNANLEHEIEFSLEGDCSRINMDENLLRHVLTNLLSNAIKYSPQGGLIKFDLIYDGNVTVFRIQDTGIGIPSEYLNQLFHSFQRASNVGAIQGTGLGLAIVKKCVDLQGGTITVDSQVGVGTTFTVTLPIKSS